VPAYKNMPLYLRPPASAMLKALRAGFYSSKISTIPSMLSFENFIIYGIFL